MLEKYEGDKKRGKKGRRREEKRSDGGGLSAVEGEARRSIGARNE